MLWPTIKTPFCWDTKVLLMVAIIVVIAAVIRVGHYSRAMAGPNNQRHRERTTTHAKTIIKQRCPTGFSLSLSLSLDVGLPIAILQPLLGAMFSLGVSTTRCASFRDKKYDRRSFLRQMRRSSRNYSNYLPPTWIISNLFLRVPLKSFPRISRRKNIDRRLSWTRINTG